jgi:hypothetical protein
MIRQSKSGPPAQGAVGGRLFLSSPALMVLTSVKITCFFNNVF